MKSRQYTFFNRKEAFNRIDLVSIVLLFFLLFGCKTNAPLSHETSLLIRNGTIVNYNGSMQADILIRGEKIVEVSSRIKVGKNTRVIDATGMEVLPGGIDPHVHITGPFVDDFQSGSQAAAAGGITTIGNLSLPEQGQSLLEMTEAHKKQVENTSIIDVMITPTITTASVDNQELLSALAAEGYTSMKIFMASQAFIDDIPGFIKVLEIAKKEGILPMIHCEDLPLIKKTQQELIAQGKRSLLFYGESRPVEAEVKATKWAVQICEELNVPVYIVHLSSQRALEVCQDAQKRGLPVFVETRPIYLYFEADKYKAKNGQLYTGMPPLRFKNDVEALWKGLADGSIHTLASDHAPWTDKQKLNPENDILNPYAGVSNLQVMLPMLYSEGVLKNRLAIEQFVAVTSTNAAKLFGLFPRKGLIAKGSDADIVIWDRKEKHLIDYNFGFSKAGFSLYQGFEVTGWPKYTIRRGKVILENGKITANSGTALSLKRKKWQAFDLH